MDRQLKSENGPIWPAAVAQIRRAHRERARIVDAHPGENGPETGSGKAISEAQFIEDMMQRINEACGSDFTAQCVEQARSRDSELDRMLRKIEQRPIND